MDDRGEKKGDWFAEKNAEDDDDIFLKVMAGKDLNLELSSPCSISHNLLLFKDQVLLMH